MMTFNFFRIADHYEVVKNGTIYTYSAEMMVCMDRQYKLMGYIKWDLGVAISYTKDEKEIEKFLKKLTKKG